MDVLADVLSVTRLGATVIAQAELVPPWGLEVDSLAEAHVHVVQRGSCWLRTTGQRKPVHLGTGDVVLIRGGVDHSICDDPRTLPAFDEPSCKSPRPSAQGSSAPSASAAAPTQPQWQP